MRQTPDTTVLSTLESERLKVFYAAFEGTDAHFTSENDRTFLDKIEYTYGEVSAIHFSPILEYVNPQPGEVFIDLGCGGGRPQSIAALFYPDLKMARGIEILTKLCDLARETTTNVKNNAAKAGLQAAPMEVIEADILQSDWSEGDIVYSSSVCFTDILTEGIADKSS